MPNQIFQVIDDLIRQVVRVNEDKVARIQNLQQ